jgi:hypothetical protein
MKLHAQESLQRTADQVTIADDGPKVELALIRDQIAYVTEFIEILEGDEKRFAEAVKANKFDLEFRYEEIEWAEGLAKRLGAKIQTLEVELKAPPLVRLMETATVVNTVRFFRRTP